MQTAVVVAVTKIELIHGSSTCCL